MVSGTLRSRLATAIAIVAAVVLWYALVSGKVQHARTSCTDRGGVLLLDLDERGAMIVQWCILPDGTRERI